MEKINLLVEQQTGSIGINFEELKEKLTKELDSYRNMVFTEESRKEAKATVAELRKLKKAVSDKRIEVKKEFMLPYNEFEEKIKELDALIDEPIRFINQQIEAFEQQRVEKKKELIRQVYAENIAELEEILPLERIYDKRWENATTSRKAIEEAIAERVTAVKRDMQTIRAMDSDAVEKAVEVYVGSYSLNDAITYINNWERQKAEILERQENKKAQENSTMPEAMPTGAPKEAKQELAKNLEPESVMNDKAKLVVYEVKADPFQLVQLEDAMSKFNIEYRRVQ